jgi:hypothetical protein
MSDFRHSGQGTDRRRRVLSDDALVRQDVGDASLDSTPGQRPARGTRKSKPRYAEAARMDAQPRITDLIPQKAGTLALLCLAGLLTIAGLEALYFYMPRLAAMTTDGRVAAFDLDSEGSLAAWFSSLVLLGSALMSLVIWSLRRHRLDDYHGRYRIWFWAAAVWCLMSIDESCSLHEGFKEMMTWLTGQRLLGDGSIWWVTAYALLLGTVGLQLLLEMRSCRGSTAAFVLAGICWVAAVVAQLQWIMPDTGALGVMVEEACEMLGDVFLLLAMTLHARHVVFDIEGKLKSSQAKPKRRRKTATKEDEETEESSQRSSAPATIREKKAVAAVSGSQSGSTAAGRATSKTSESRPTGSKPGGQVLRTDPPENVLAGRKLTKAERRAQRRLEKQN